MTSEPRHLCLFDLDGTLIPIDSDHAFGEFMVSIGWADADEFRRRNDVFYADYQAGTLDLTAYIEFATGVWRNRPLAEAEQARERFMAEVIGAQLHPAAFELVREHQARGDLVAIVTATNEFVTTPIAAALGVEHLLAVQLERTADAAWTGRIRGTPTFREGKVARVHDWLAGLGHQIGDFSGISVYSDSPNDLPLMELATEPVATNPSPALEATAVERGWRILRLFP
ncbi:HAD-superfamily subfamily IB hydrolase, TIGR01490 [Leptothrix cholodnii SP-6]|uniref:HAD-superfamily subfamily IB hydrolase, TIGR01490 n=1 Tax=Leptothrix cholodnii (strain ATCC 51168 / LMG 8142 / SP-6) TaxID=395495 RepID=B1Y0G8_LEPCP|nr:HAD family hydrolase [Leptothrix cholodnii]ACB32949.1 HAD-superfamily subfamily IB hydrolase, TIGR01490 [Leptothrix cholodnii SP-6]